MILVQLLSAGTNIRREKMSNFDEHLLEELKDPEVAAGFILDALEEPGDKFSYLMKAISQVAKAHGLSYLVEASDLGKSSVYKMIQEDSNPTLKNVMKIFRAMGLKISVDVDEDKPANVLDVAQYIMNNSRRAKSETTWWLQKLAYFANWYWWSYLDYFSYLMNNFCQIMKSK